MLQYDISFLYYVDITVPVPLYHISVPVSL